MARDILELGGSLGFLDEIYEQFQAQPGGVDASWYDVLRDGDGEAQPAPQSSGSGNGERLTTGTTRAMPMFDRPGAVTLSPLQAQTPSVWPLVNAYRSRGHFAANLDPLGLLETARIS